MGKTQAAIVIACVVVITVAGIMLMTRVPGWTVGGEPVDWAYAGWCVTAATTASAVGKRVQRRV